MLRSQFSKTNSLIRSFQKRPISLPPGAWVSKQDPLNPKPENTAGVFFHSLLYRSRGANRLALGDLKQLLLLCHESKHVIYIKKGVQLFQTKGQDFSEEICSIFVKACVRIGHPQAAAEEFIKYKNRIGAWLTQTSFFYLVDNMPNVSDAELLVQTLEIAIIKGLKPSRAAVQLILKRCVDKGDPLLHARTIAASKGVFDNEIINTLTAEFPAPEDLTTPDEEDAIAIEGSEEISVDAEGDTKPTP